MRRIRRFNWTCGSSPPTLILHREAATLTKIKVWDRILTGFNEKFRLIDWARLIEVAMLVAGVRKRKGVNSHGEGKGVYGND